MLEGNIFIFLARKIQLLNFDFKLEVLQSRVRSR